ncbi:MAG: NAD(+) diphosphatase, partial [Alphaproteobacteria bacterium]
VLPANDWAAIEADGDTPIYLGVYARRHYFAADLSRAAEPPLAALGAFTDLRQAGPLLPRFEGSLLAYARGLVHWHGRHGYCGVCGARTRPADGGHVRRCANDSCGATHFPRTDPAIIVLVTHGDQALVGRSPHWPVGTYSALAGFVEPGESLEMPVAREVHEEVGLTLPLDGIRYSSSQPWPFPASIMLGFYAEATDTALTLDHDEIEAALWLHRDDLRDAADGSFRLPRADSIARRLITDWLQDG